ncbi:MAG: hypothetical protein Q7J24_17195 [Desulfomicrobium sp.]|nr:hypothetical protein [Desulfomicrobium sp.]
METPFLAHMSAPLRRIAGKHFFLVACLLFMVTAPVRVAAVPTAAVNLPQAIAGMELVRAIKGDEAAAIIDRLHHGTVATRANAIGEYEGGGRSATYYVSLYDDPRQAVQAMEDMAAVMSAGGHGFSHLMKRTAEGLEFYMALGQGQAHYFFARGEELVWLAVDMEVAEGAVKEIL